MSSQDRISVSSLNVDSVAPQNGATKSGAQGGSIPQEANRPASRKSRLHPLTDNTELANRFRALRQISRQVRSSEYHLTNACNIRCQGCWFFEYDFDAQTSEPTSIDVWRRFASEQAQNGITSALLIGGEPTLYLDRIAAFVEAMKFVTISSNGLAEFPMFGFENVAVALSLFGGVDLDDGMRAIKPNGERFRGLFDRALLNYKNDPRATFIYAIDASACDVMDETVRRIADNGNFVSFNYYSSYGKQNALSSDGEERLLETALKVAQLYPEAVLSHPYYISALITGRTEWGEFGYDSCPSISVGHPAHKERLRNGNPVLPGFNTFAADTKEITFCCTSGHCESCRDSQAVQSWLLTNFRHFMRMDNGMTLWIELSESYWSQFVWSKLRPSRAIKPT